MGHVPGPHEAEHPGTGGGGSSPGVRGCDPALGQLHLRAASRPSLVPISRLVAESRGNQVPFCTEGISRCCGRRDVAKAVSVCLVFLPSPLGNYP